MRNVMSKIKRKKNFGIFFFNVPELQYRPKRLYLSDSLIDLIYSKSYFIESIRINNYVTSHYIWPPSKSKHHILRKNRLLITPICYLNWEIWYVKDNKVIKFANDKKFKKFIINLMMFKQDNLI